MRKMHKKKPQKGGEINMTYKKLDEIKKEKVTRLLETCEVFFAFNEKQYNEGKEKYNISSKNKVTSIGGGGFVPVKNVKALEMGFEAIEKWYREQEKDISVVIKPKKISKEKYWEMLEVLPPIYHNNGVFQVSEPHDHITVNDKMCATYSTYQQKNKGYYYLGILTRQQARDYSNK